MKAFNETGYSRTIWGHAILHVSGIALSFLLYWYDGTVDQTTYNKWKADILVHQPKIKAYKILKEKTLYDASVIAAPFGIFYGIVWSKRLKLNNIERVLKKKVKITTSCNYFFTLYWQKGFLRRILVYLMIFGGVYAMKEVFPPPYVKTVYCVRQAIFLFNLIFFFTGYPILMSKCGW